MSDGMLNAVYRIVICQAMMPYVNHFFTQPGFKAFGIVGSIMFTQYIVPCTG